MGTASPEVLVEVRRSYLRLCRLSGKLGETDRRELRERVERLTVWAQEAEEWIGERDGALAECLTWVVFVAGALVANWRDFDPARHRAVLLVIKHALKPAASTSFPARHSGKA